MPDLKLTGFNADTGKKLLLDAGAIYKNFDKTLMTGTLVGATSGGNTFTAKPNMRRIAIDGVKSEDVKGLTVIDSWSVSLATNLLEFTKDTIVMALGSASVTAQGTDYESIKGNNYIADSDYLQNIAYVGKISGSAKPVIIIIYNAMNKEGMSVNMKDADEGKLPVTFTGNLDSANLDAPPFEILYPKVVIP